MGKSMTIYDIKMYHQDIKGTFFKNYIEDTMELFLSQSANDITK